MLAKNKKTALLLDLDGVIVKKNPLFPVVSLRCQRFLQKYVSVRNTSKISELNTQLYDSCGHTVLGLQKLGYNVSIKEFNNYIYDFVDYSKMRYLAEENPSEVKHLDHLLKFCGKNNVDPYVFSNAPPVWVNTSLYYLAPTMQSVKVITNTKTNLKPNKVLYDEVEEDLSSYEKIIFVDDKIINLLPIIQRPKWQGVLLSSSIQAEPVLSISEHNLSIVQNLKGVEMYLESITSCIAENV